ncbi:MAG: N-acetyltransferase [Elusimicrobia bacterium CG08_land_8_20_14_0_20_59_10]|nr:MAG: N-acetyltransferase [Elusimicrobia bacterium CG08_land_8_20_14_0_20_59_10]
MPDRLQLRFIKKTDPAGLKRIITLYRAQGWWRPSDTPRGLARLIKGSHCFLLAQRGGRLAGMGRAISDGAGDAYIQDVVVAASERGSGVGSKIIRALLARLKTDGITWIGLIAQDNSAPFYSRLGFRELKRSAPMLLKGSHV